jgi:large subunit ribosomal protein L11
LTILLKLRIIFVATKDFMAKEITGMLKLQIEAGKANPAPPVGPALGQKGVNIMDFCKKFNDKTKDKMGKIIPVVITVYKDKSFTFICKQPPTSFLIRQQLKLKKGARTPGRTRIATLSRAQVEAVAKEKMEDLNALDLEAAVKIVAGQARSMGIDVKL